MARVIEIMCAKYRIRFFFEWSDPAYLWAGDEHTTDTFGDGPIQDVLPLSDETLKRGAELSEWYQTSLNWEYPPDPAWYVATR